MGRERLPRRWHGHAHQPAPQRRSGGKKGESSRPPPITPDRLVPASEVVRGFGSWFFQSKCELLESGIKRSGEHPALWEKTGTSLYTVTNVTRYAELRKFTNRLFNEKEALDGFVFYVGLKTTAEPKAHDSNRLCAPVFLEAIERIDGFRRCARCSHRTRTGPARRPP